MMKWIVTEKVKTINNKYEQSKAQYNLDRQTSKISVLSSGSVGKYELLKDKDILPEKKLLGKPATIKRIQKQKKRRLSLRKELEKQTNIVKNLYN